MVQALREKVTVGEDGMIHVKATGLPAGTAAEVIVLSEVIPQDVQKRLEAFEWLQKDLALTKESAEAWVKEAAEERKASSRL